MRYIVRISGMIIGVLLGSAVLATALSQFTTRLAFAGLDGAGLFVGLVTMGFMVAILTRESWLAA
ncbi:MAG: hypothetical protein QM779_01565 [Propionicimonas sp.]|uniref:hypothetical protein n=1 Tax=Propionicimonas sp. TaxID=1955623 RepID=UPI003D0AAC2B